MIRILILSMVILCGCSKKKALDKPANDFESLMGSQLPAWEYVQTKEDFENLSLFKQIYESKISCLEATHHELKIPKIIHFIWVGPRSFPMESVENIRSWIAHHPDWTIKFWTDRERPLPHPVMQLCLASDFDFQKLESLYLSSDNYGEKSDLWRFEILFQQGGVYVDHDVKCFKSFDSLNSAYDLYCGLEVPHPTPLSSSVIPTNNLIGAKPGHPVLAKSMDWLLENWNQLEKHYPGNDRDAIITRIAHRSFSALGVNFKAFANQQDLTDIAFPSFYFNSPKSEWALFAQHQYKGTWFENESEFEMKTRKRLMMLSKKTNKLLLALGVLAGLNVFGFMSLGILVYRKKSI